MLQRFFRQVPWIILVPAAILLGLAPFQPEPHLFEKLRLLVHGELLRPVDIFDLVFHAAPVMLIPGKLWFGRNRQSPGDAPRA